MTPGRVLAQLRERGQTVATAESLTGGLLCAELTSVAGSSAVVVGGVVCYATRTKADVLGVDRVLLAERGAVDPDVAQQMAAGVRRLLGATWGVATTGVAGPEPADGQDVGTVFVAVAGEERSRVRALRLEGDRSAVRAGSVACALALLAEAAAAREEPCGGSREHGVGRAGYRGPVRTWTAAPDDCKGGVNNDSASS